MKWRYRHRNIISFSLATSSNINQFVLRISENLCHFDLALYFLSDFTQIKSESLTEVGNITFKKLGKSILISTVMDVSGHGGKWHPTVNLFIYSVLLNTAGGPSTAGVISCRVTLLGEVLVGRKCFGTAPYCTQKE